MRILAHVLKKIALLPESFSGSITLHCNGVTRSWAIEVLSREHVKTGGEDLVDLHDILIPRLLPSQRS